MINTERFKLRPWRDSDEIPYRTLCADPRVMEHLGGPLSPADASAEIAQYRLWQEKHGHTLWAIERKSDYSFLGMCGLKVCDDVGSPIEGKIEISWRLRRDVWGQHVAKDSAYACFDWAFMNLDCEHVYAKTISANTRAWGLMDRLRMRRRAELDFTDTDNPALKYIVYARAKTWD